MGGASTCPNLSLCYRCSCRQIASVSAIKTVPNVSLRHDHVRRAVDDRRLPGQFILTGSAVPADDATRHTGAGRLTRLRMRPLSLFELGRSSGEVSLAALLDGEHVSAGRAVIPLDDLAELICVGGWPVNLGRSTRLALRANVDHLDEIRRLDIANGDGRRRDPVRVGMLLRSLARNVATPAATATLASDTGEGVSAITEHTAAGYLRALERIMIVENQPAWPTHLRSRSVLRRKPVRHLTDPSLAVAAVRATPTRLLRDLDFLGLLFESMGSAGSEGLRPGRGRRGVPLPGEGGVGSGRDRAGERRSLGGFRGQAGGGEGG